MKNNIQEINSPSPNTSPSPWNWKFAKTKEQKEPEYKECKHEYKVGGKNCLKCDMPKSNMSDFDMWKREDEDYDWDIKEPKEPMNNIQEILKRFDEKFHTKTEIHYLDGEIKESLLIDEIKIKQFIQQEITKALEDIVPEEKEESLRNNYWFQHLPRTNKTKHL